MINGWIYQDQNQMSRINTLMYDNDSITILNMNGIHFSNAENSRWFTHLTSHAQAIPPTANNNYR